MVTADAGSAGLSAPNGKPSRKTGRTSGASVAASPTTAPFFEIYKPGQGYYTRMCSAVGAGVLIAGAGNFLYNQMEAYVTDAAWTTWLQVGVPSVVVVVLGLLLYWLVGVKRGTCDFLIATEGEMKKVSWSSRNELIGSTKVVIVATVMLSVFLFVVDLVFMKFFHFINVLETGS